MALVTCPRCGANNPRGGFHGCVWVSAIIFFPIGLLAFLVGRRPTVCANCHNSYVA